mmetsp:Transcript_54492/g.127437  ORF Transcript_54492/g.127437 Transcript_54492/m.127437 type:complete len:170 (-) Transcript_54492:99-608(-)|eukprot:1598484-Rhodomonas_salina.1
MASEAEVERKRKNEEMSGGEVAFRHAGGLMKRRGFVNLEPVCVGGVSAKIMSESERLAVHEGSPLSSASSDSSDEDNVWIIDSSAEPSPATEKFDSGDEEGCKRCASAEGVGFPQNQCDFDQRGPSRGVSNGSARTKKVAIWTGVSWFIKQDSPRTPETHRVGKRRKTK